jgi:hypothetical protein
VCLTGNPSCDCLLHEYRLQRVPLGAIRSF